MIASAAFALVSALRYLAEASIALALAAAAIVTRIMALLAHGVAYLSGLIADALPGLLPALRGLIVLACVGVEVIAVAFAFAASWQAFGRDLAAILPSAVLVILPIYVAVTHPARQFIGAILIAGIATWIEGLIISAIPAIAQVLIIATAIAWLVFKNITTRSIA